MSLDKAVVILLPYKHRFSRLYAELVHSKGHSGVLTTTSKICTRFCIIKLLKLVKSIKFNCVTCRKLGKLPLERLKPASPWSYTALDLFGPFKIWNEVKKRTFRKAYGVIFNCLGTRAVYIYLSADYSRNKFLMVPFVSLRGYPRKLYSGNGTQLVAASEALKKMIQGLKKEDLVEFGITEGLQWCSRQPTLHGKMEYLIQGHNDTRLKPVFVTAFSFPRGANVVHCR